MPRNDINPEQPKRQVTHITIPIEIWTHPTLSTMGKVLAAEIRSLQDPERGCYASNAYLAKFMGLSVGRVSHLISELKAAEIIQQVNFDGRWRSLRLGRLAENSYPDSLKIATLPSRKQLPYTIAKNNSKEEPKTSPQKTKTFSEAGVEIELSQRLLNRIIAQKQDFKLPNIQQWAKVIDRMLRIDKRSRDRIAAVIDWCQTSDFWHSNILSTEKLRIKFDILESQMRRDAPTRQPRVRKGAGEFYGVPATPGKYEQVSAKGDASISTNPNKYDNVKEFHHESR